MSLRAVRARAGDKTLSGGDQSLGPHDDPSLAAVIAGSEFDLRPTLGVLLVLVGGLLGVAVLVVFGIVILSLAWLRALWMRRALRQLRLERRFEPDRVICGDAVHLVVTVWNRKLMPLPWLRAEEALPAELRSEDDPSRESGQSVTRTLVNGWTLGPHERVTRRIDLIVDRRGVYRFGALTVSAGDLLGEEAAAEERLIPATLIVRPRTLPIRRPEAARDRSGVLRARRSLIEDASRFAGVRPYTPSDPVRHLHWRATARLGVPVVKRFDPSRDRDVVIALDIQTADQAWTGRHDDELAETLCVVAASLARVFEAEGSACGLAVAAYTGSTQRLAFLAPNAAERQSGRVGDLLARISPYPSAPFEYLLGRLVRMIRPGTLVVIVSGRDPVTFLPLARRLVRGGFGVVHLAAGPDAAAHARRSRATGVTARSIRLDGDWRTARTIDVAS
jgi:uncharacterized protein (DUF58 family)